MNDNSACVDAATFRSCYPTNKGLRCSILIENFWHGHLKSIRSNDCKALLLLRLAKEIYHFHFVMKFIIHSRHIWRLLGHSLNIKWVWVHIVPLCLMCLIVSSGSVTHHENVNPIVWIILMIYTSDKFNLNKIIAQRRVKKVEEGSKRVWSLLWKSTSSSQREGSS